MAISPEPQLHIPHIGVPDRLRAARVDAGLTQEQLAESSLSVLDLTWSMVHSWSMAKADLIPGAEAAKRLGVSIRTLNRRVAQGAIVPAAEAPGIRGARLYDADEIDALAAPDPAPTAGG